MRLSGLFGAGRYAATEGGNEGGLMKKDYLAIIFMMAGSSYARGPDLEDCVKRVGKIVVSDWGSMFDVKGKPATVACYDVTGHDSLHWDYRVFDSKTDEEIPLLEKREITLPTK